MIWLIPLLLIGVVLGREKVDDDDRAWRDQQLAQEKAKLKAEEDARRAAAAKAAASKELGEQYLAMKPAMAGMRRSPMAGMRRVQRRRREINTDPFEGYRSEMDFNGENPRHL